MTSAFSASSRSSALPSSTEPTGAASPFDRHTETLSNGAAISRDGKTWPVPGRVGNLARLFGSLVAIPILRMAGR